MDILTTDKNYKEFIETHESELVERTTSFQELLAVLKYVDVITSQEFDEFKRIPEFENGQIRHFYRLLAKKGTGQIKLIQQALRKTSNVQVAELLEIFLHNNCAHNTNESFYGWVNPRFSRTQMDKRFHLPVLNSNRPNNSQVQVVQPPEKQFLTVSKDNSGNSSYHLKSTPRGYALIVNNDISNLHANCSDSVNLNQLFLNLGFRSTIVEDLEETELSRTIVTFKKKFQANADCCVIVLLDHNCGSINNGDGSIKMTNGENVHLIHNFFLQFNGENCPELNGKPKLIFIQSSQRNLEYFKDKAIVELLSQVMKDTFIVFFTAPQNKMQHKKCHGTNFVSLLTKVLMKRASSKEFSSMMNTVSAEMERSPRTSENEQLYYQNFLCKPLWFNTSR